MVKPETPYLVLTNALVLTSLANFRVVTCSERLGRPLSQANLMLTNYPAGKRGTNWTIPRLPALHFWFSRSVANDPLPARRSLHLITVQPLFSTIHCKCLYSIANNVVHILDVALAKRARLLKARHRCLRSTARTYASAASRNRESVATRAHNSREGLP
jgi:hypothetical protein